MSKKLSRICPHPFEQHPDKEFLAHYNDKGYDKPSVTADILVLGSNSDFSRFRILLVKRGGHPFLGSWTNLRNETLKCVLRVCPGCACARNSPSTG